MSLSLFRVLKRLRNEGMRQPQVVTDLVSQRVKVRMATVIHGVETAHDDEVVIDARKSGAAGCRSRPVPYDDNEPAGVTPRDIVTERLDPGPV